MTVLATPFAPAASADELAARARRTFAEFDELLGRVDRAGPPFTVVNLLEPLNEIQLVLANLGTECGLLEEVHPELAVREAAEGARRELVPYQMRLTQHRGVYDALGRMDAAALDAHARRVVTLLRRDMRRAGVELDDAARERVRELREDLVRLGQEFARNIRDDVRGVGLDRAEQLAGLPEDYVRAHPPGPDGKIRITTDGPDLIPFMAYGKDGEARRALNRANRTRAAPRNLEVLAEMLARRHELARLLGYATWADYVTEERMLTSCAAVRAFIDEARAIASAKAARERAQLVARKQRDDPAAASLAEWELDYYLERVKAEELAFDAREARPYFPYPLVRQAVLDLFGELFGLGYARVAAPTWHEAVETFDVTIDGEPAGRIALDMHPREGKFKHAAHFTLRVGVGGRQLPFSVLVCNLPDPSTGPALMDHREVVTFFHEFGHLVHALARGKNRWLRIANVTEHDFIEAPSQFLEEWMFDHGVLRRFARHHETGEPIPEPIVMQLRAARDFGRGLWVQRQLFFAAVSLAYHDRDPGELDVTRLFFELGERYSPVTLDPEGRFPANFGHLDGYSAAYYTYLISLAISKDLHSAFTHGLMDMAQARRYRDLILAPGGSKPATDLVSDFLGRPYSLDAFRRWLEA